jgi:hypothetical protein
VAALDVLIPTYCRAGALAVTLAGLIPQSFGDFRVIVSDQSEASEPTAAPDVQTVLRVLALHGRRSVVHKHLPRRGMAARPRLQRPTGAGTRPIPARPLTHLVLSAHPLRRCPFRPHTWHLLGIIRLRGTRNINFL